MQKLKGCNVEEDGPGVWFTNMKVLKELKLQTVLVQNTCDICGFRQNDNLLTLRRLITEEKQDTRQQQQNHPNNNILNHSYEKGNNVISINNNEILA